MLEPGVAVKTIYFSIAWQDSVAVAAAWSRQWRDQLLSRCSGMEQLAFGSTKG
jgi:hypothetical protein